MGLAAMTTRMHFRKLSCSLGCTLGLGLTGCVVSTHGGPGTPPDVPLPPEPATTAASDVADGPREIGAQHILISYKGAMRAAPYIARTKDEARELAEELRQRAVEGEDFKKLAQDNSDDRGSAASGGSLGTFTRDKMVPQFSKAAFALEVAEVSDVVESPFGFHVILRTQ